MNRTLVLLLLAVPAGSPAAAQQSAATPVPQRVTAPSLPDQQNKEGVVRPSGAVATDVEGNVRNRAGSIDVSSSSPAAAPGAPPAPGAPAPGAPVPAMPAPPAAVPAPRGPAVVDAAHVTLRGVMKAYTKGSSITIRQGNGRDRTVPLLEKAAVEEGLVVGDQVVVRIPLQKPADGKSADRVEKQKPGATPPPSKFSTSTTPKG